MFLLIPIGTFISLRISMMILAILMFIRLHLTMDNRILISHRWSWCC
jgi:hypothetical protein